MDDGNSALVARSRPSPPMGKPSRPTLLLCTLCWCSLIAGLVLQLCADGWVADTVMDELKHYDWRSTTVDASAAAILCAFSTTTALIVSRAQLAVLVACAFGAVLLVKAAMLAPPPSSACRACALWSGALAATSAIAIALASLHLVLSRRRHRSASGTGGAEALLPINAAKPPEAPQTGGNASFARLVGLARPEAPLLALATLALFVTTASQMAMPGLVGALMQVIAPGSGDNHERYSKLKRVVAQLAVIFTVGGFAGFVRGWLFNLSGERVVARLRRRLFARLIVQEVGFFDGNKTGELMNRLASDTAVIQNAVTTNVSMGLRFGAQVIIGILLIFLVSWRLSLVMLSIVPAVMVVAICYGRAMKNLSKRYQDALSNASTTAQEAFSSVRTVRSFAQEAREAARYDTDVDASYALGRSKALMYGAFGGVISCIGQFAVVVVLWYGGSLVIRGDGMTFGDLTAFLLYTIMIAGALGALSDLFGSLMNAVGASARVFELMDREPSSEIVGGATPDAVAGLLEFRQVSFSYPSRPDTAVLERIDLTVQPASVVALCGPSGSGKSTVIGLLERWYEPTLGEIWLDGMPLASVDASWWRRQVALVAQEPVLFACSIADNISYGCSAATIDAVQEAARTANALSFIEGFPEGFETLVGERGVQLSGGQKQRVAIARALLVDPKVLLLDEATSALDSESEHVVQEAIDRLMRARTTIVIAHRLSTVRGADCICVVHKGRIVEKGGHAALIEQDGLYKRLVKRQMAGQVPASSRFESGLDRAALDAAES